MRTTLRLNRKVVAWHGLVLALLVLPGVTVGQERGNPPNGRNRLDLANPPAETQRKQANLIEQVVDAELIFELNPSRSKVVKTKKPISRISVTNPEYVEINEFSPYEFEVIGRRSGETTLTLWFGREGEPESETIRYLVRVAANEVEQERAEIEYGRLQDRLNELFPNSQIMLIPIADKVIVRGQARDSQEAAQILAVLGGRQAAGQAAATTGANLMSTGLANLPGAEDLRNTSLINMLHVPGEQQVMLKVRIAEISRNSNRELGANFGIFEDSFSITHFIGGAGNLTAILDNQDIQLFIRAFTTHGYGKILAEPNLVTLSGQPATFIAGGEFAVPTAVGVDGIAAASTYFRGFGTQLAFTPTVVDKDKIRLQVAPSFSSLNQANAVDGIPGLDTRAVTTTVDLREGQWLAIAGLIQDEQGGSRRQLPVFGSIPVAGALFGAQNVTRDETELIVLISPELVHPLEPEQAPALLPGMEVTEPTNKDFFLLQRVEGLPEFHHRSTVWRKYQQEMRSARWRSRGRESYYVVGPQGFSE